jgi:hypothetical protein
MKLPRAIRRLRRKVSPSPAQQPWVSLQGDGAPEPLERIRLFAVLGTWMEADVVEASVRNAITQGCERVYLVDNDSPDDTVRIARAAGAEVARVFATETYDELLRMRLMNDVVREVSGAESDEHIWWLWIDADEFAHGSGGRTLHQHLSALDRRCRIVGTRYFNHYPTDPPHYVEGHHPLDYQPFCEELELAMCPRRHRKHPLQRWDRSGPFIECLAGFHRATSVELPLIEANEAAILHHFPFRSEEMSRRRLEVLCGKESDSTSRAKDGDPATGHMLPRYRSLDAVYRQQWDAVENFMPGAERHGVHLCDWESLVEDRDRHIERWYTQTLTGPSDAAERT